MANLARRFIGMFLAEILAVSLMISAFSASGTGELDVGGKRYNIELVVDGSGSLKKESPDSTDPEENRFNALNYMFTTLDFSGNEIGAFVFNAQPREVSPLRPIRSEADKDKIYADIKAIAPDGNTDIGGALLAAVNKLVARQRQQDEESGEHLPSVVILFTDGMTDPDTAASREARNKAIQLAKENGIQILGVFLNHDGKIIGNQEVFDIVRAVRDVASDPVVPRDSSGDLNSLEGMYSEINSGKDIRDSFHDIVQWLKGRPSNNTPETVPMEKSCLIPGIGVSELNFSVRYNPGVGEKIAVSILSPDGSVIREISVPNVIVKKTDVFYNAKIKAPAKGNWLVRVDKSGHARVDETIEVIPDIIASTDVSAMVELLEPEGGAKLKDNVTFSSWLEKSGQPVDDSKKYDYFDCTLTLTSIKTQQTSEIPMSLNEEGRFISQTRLEDFEGYTAFVTYSCGDTIRFRSNEITARATNQPPEPKTHPIKLAYRFNFLSKGVYTVNVSNFAKDPEGEAVFYEMQTSRLEAPWDNADFDPTTNILQVNTHKQVDSGILYLMAADPQGASSEIQIVLSSKNVTLLHLLLLLVGLLALAGLFFLIKLLLGRRYIHGKMIIRIEGAALDPSLKYLQYTGKEVNLLQMGPSFSLEKLCEAYKNEFNPEAEALVLKELTRLFNKNNAVLRKVSFKLKGRKGNAFIFTSENGKQGSYEVGTFSNKEVSLDGGIRMKLTCQKIPKPGSGKRDYRGI